MKNIKLELDSFRGIAEALQISHLQGEYNALGIVKCGNITVSAKWINPLYIGICISTNTDIKSVKRTNALYADEFKLNSSTATNVAEKNILLGKAIEEKARILCAEAGIQLI